MPKAEVGSTKWVANKMRRKGLQRLRWYCQLCEKQCPDQHGFEMHTKSESHVRRTLAVGEDPRKVVEEFSREFHRNFIQLLKTGHGEKSIPINRFYQDVIAHKEHVHMNATKWPSLTEYAKYLGREGICRVVETDKGIEIAWIDNSPEALRRQDELRRKEAQDRGNEEVEQMMIREQIKRAQKAAEARGDKVEDEDEKDYSLKREEGEKIKLSFGAKPAAAAPAAAEAPSTSTMKEADNTASASESPAPEAPSDAKPATDKPSLGGGLSLKMTAKPQTKNVFAVAKKNALSSSGPKKNAFEQPKKMSEAERIMREDMERMKKRGRETPGSSAPSWKKQKTDR